MTALRLVRDPDAVGSEQDHECALNTHQVRRFVGMSDDEPTELTGFIWGRPRVAHARTADEHVRLLRELESVPGYSGSFMLANRINPQCFYRYPLGEWTRGHLGRVSDKEIVERRAFFIDVDSVRVKNISATDDEKRAAWDVAQKIREFLTGIVGENAIGFGDSGNGYYLLVALEPKPPADDESRKLARFLQLLDTEFTTPEAKVDKSVFNAARLMPAPGTTKGKGVNAAERPHRFATFSCRPTIARVPVEVICG